MDTPEQIFISKGGLMSNIRLIVTDLDFTLLRSDQSISDYTAEVFHKCSEAGILTAFATARFIHGVQNFIDRIHPDYAVLNDGTMIYHKTSFLFGLPLDPQAVHGLITNLKKLDPDIQLSAAAQEIVYRNHHQSGYTNFTPMSAFADFEQPFTDTIFKLVASPSRDEYKEEFPALAQKYGCKTFQYRGENRHAFLSEQAGKFAGIQKLANHLQIPLSQVAAFGDDRNDIEMIQNCGLGIAVSNAIPELKAAADAHTCSNDEDGVARYIEKYLL